jgi:putative transposase
MPKGLVRLYGLGHLHFITFSCYHRLPLLGTVHARNSFVQVLAVIRDRFVFRLVGYVVMPEHVHLLISEPSRGTPSSVLQKLKQDVSRKLRATSSGSQIRQPQFWQTRFYDFNVYSLEKKIEKLNYMHMNPLKRGLVTNPKDWPWSSYAFCQEKGTVLISIDPV